MYKLLRPLLFALKPEMAHTVTLSSLKLLHALFGRGIQQLNNIDNPTTVFGLPFKNPVGLAAGLDKNGDYIDALGSQGFGFIEIGSITPKPQAGNPKPRMFRLPKQEAVINRMGFNNKGLDHLLHQLNRYRGGNFILGVNIGKNAVTPIENALDDYLLCFNAVYPFADYITANLSSPNTPGLRELQHGEHLRALITGLDQARKNMVDDAHPYKPIVYKVAPDLSEEDIHQVCDILNEQKVDGIIVSNTTISRPGECAQHEHANEAGGLSGQPLAPLSLQALTLFRQALDTTIPIISAGGIDSAQEAQKRIDAGASLVQIYTGLIFKGPSLIKELAKKVQLRGS